MKGKEKRRKENDKEWEKIGERTNPGKEEVEGRKEGKKGTKERK